MKRLAIIVFFCLLSFILCPIRAKDTTYVSGAIQHEGLLDWTPVMYHSNSYVDFSVHHLRRDTNRLQFTGIRATTRAELTQWPLLGYERDFPGYGISHLSLAANFHWGEITVGDVYGQFGSGLILNLYEDRAIGVDGALRGAKIVLQPYKGIEMTLLGGKQRRYWQCYTDRAFGWNYTRDAALGADVEIHIEQWSKRMQELEMGLCIGGSYVSKYEHDDTIVTIVDNSPYMYRLPLWVGAGDIRAEWRMKGWNILVEYAYKANDPSADNNYSYRHGDALLASVSYSRKGLAVLAQIKRSDNMSFRTERTRTGFAGRLNQMPPFAQQHTYSLATQYPYATQYANGEWSFQGEVRYTFSKKTRMGGRYGTSLKLAASHIRGLASEGSWAVDASTEGEYYTDVNVEFNKRLSSRWWLNAMLMYQAYNQKVLEGKGGMIRGGLAVLDARFRVNKNVSMHGELQYFYTPHHEGQWIYALYEINLYNCVTLTADYMYNIGFAPEASNEHFYNFLVTYTHKAHQLTVGYVKTQDGFNCSGGICRFIPQQKGITLNYNFSW